MARNLIHSSARNRLFALIFVAICAVAGFGTTNAGATTQPNAVPGTNVLTSSNPAANQVVSGSITQLQLVFRDPLASADTASQMGLSLACGGNVVGLGVPQLGNDFKTVSAALTQIPPAGQCVVSWSLPPPDKSTGSFTFTSNVVTQTTLASVDGVPITVNTTAVPLIGETIGQQVSRPRVGGIIGLLRILEYLLMASIFGGLALVITAWPEGITYEATIRHLRNSWIACVVILYLILTLSTMQEASKGFTASLSPLSWLGSLTSGSGIVLILRFALVVSCGWVALFPSRANDPAHQFAAVTLLVTMIATLGFSRLGQDVAIFTYVLGAVHALAVAYWVGGLILLLRVILIGPGEEDLVNAMYAFSKHTVLAFGVTMFTGLLQIYLLDSSSILTSGHGRLGVLKIAATIGMLFITIGFKMFAQQHFAEPTQLTGRIAVRLRRAISFELGFAVIALMITSWMVATQPPKAVAQVSAPTANYVFREELKNERFRVVISLTPGLTGINAMRIELIEPNRINNFAVKLIPQAVGYSGIQINVPLTQRGAAIIAGDGTLVLNTPGVWNILISGTTTTGELTPLSTSIAVTQASEATTVTTLPGTAIIPSATSLPTVITVPTAVPTTATVPTVISVPTTSGG